MIDVTRRDYIVAKALAYAIAAIETLPEHQRPLSDQHDMKTLFDTIVIGDLERRLEFVGFALTRARGAWQNS